MSTIAVIDYGMGNLHSIAKALEHVSGARIVITDDPELLRSADRLVFPGQGAIGQCMQKLKLRELDQLLLELMIQKPTLGICLGLQALLEFSEENGGTQGLGLIPGRVQRFSPQLTLEEEDAMVAEAEGADVDEAEEAETTEESADSDSDSDSAEG